MRLYKRTKKGPYWADYTDENGVRRRRSTGCRDKGAAQSALSRWLEQAERIKAGIVSATEAEIVKHANRPLAEHLADYEAALRAKGTARHATLTVARCRRVFDDLGVRVMRDLTPDAMARWFDARRAEDMGAVTANHHVTALKMWGNWMCRNGRINGKNPAAGLHRFNERAERRHVRRALQEDEARALIWASTLRPLAERGRERVKVSGGKRSNWMYAPLTPDNLESCAARARATLRPLVIRHLEAKGKARALCYRSGIGSGFRAGELAAMHVADFDAGAATFRLSAGDEKARRGVDGQDIPRELAEDLAAWLAERKAKPRDRLFPVSCTIKAFDRDLAAAGIAKHDERGWVLDIHALRKTYTSWLQRAGASLRQAQALARHRDPKMTANDYTDTDLLDLADCVAALPSLRPAPTAGETPENQRASGVGVIFGTPGQANEQGCA